MLARVERAGDRERLRTLRDLDFAAQRLRDVCQVVLDPQYPDAEVRAAVQKRWPEAQLLAAITIVGELTRSPDDGGYYEGASGALQPRPPFPSGALLRAILFEATPAGRSVVDALGFLRRIECAH